MQETPDTNMKLVLKIGYPCDFYFDYMKETPDTNMEDTEDLIFLPHNLYRIALEEISDTTEREWLVELLLRRHWAREKREVFIIWRCFWYDCWWWIDDIELLNDWTRRVQKIFQLFGIDLEEIPNTTKIEWLQELLSEIRQEREDITSCGQNLSRTALEEISDTTKRERLAELLSKKHLARKGFTSCGQNLSRTALEEISDSTKKEISDTTKRERLAELLSKKRLARKGFTSFGQNLSRTALEEISDTTKRERLEELLSKIRQAREDFTSCGRIRCHSWCCWDLVDPVECLLNDWTGGVQEMFNDDDDDYSFHWNNNSTRNERFKKFISKELRPLPRKELLKQLESLTLYYLQFLRLKNSFPTRNDRLKKFIFEEVWPLPNIRLLEQMESLTWDYIKHFIQKKGDRTRDDNFMNILFEQLRSLTSIELPEELEPLKLSYIKHFIQKKGYRTRDDNFMNIFFEKLRSLASTELLEPLKLAFIKYFILRKWNPDRNDGFNEIIFDETWPLPNMELLQQLKSLTLDYEKSFSPEEQDPAETVTVIKAISMASAWLLLNNIILELEIFLTSYHVDSSPITSEDAAPTWNDRFTKLESLRLFNDEESFHLKGEDAAPTWNDLLAILRLPFLSDIEVPESIILDYDEESFHLKREEATQTWCDRFTKFDFEELWFLPDIKEPKSPQSFYDEESFQLKGEDAAPTWNARWTIMRFPFLSDNEVPQSIILDNIESSHLKSEDAAPTWNDRVTKLESLRSFNNEESFHLKVEDVFQTWNVSLTLLRLPSDIEVPKPITLDYDEESFHLKVEDVVQTWTDRLKNLIFQSLLNIAMLKWPASLILNHVDSSPITSEDAAPTWNDRSTKLESLRLFNDEESFHLKREEATPTLWDRFTKFDSEALRFLPDIKEPKSPQSFYDEESFHLKREEATPTWCDRFTRFRELRFLPDIKEMKSKLLFPAAHMAGYRHSSALCRTSQSQKSGLMLMPTTIITEPLTEKTKEVNTFELLTQKVAFWSEAIIKLLLLSLFLLVDLCGFFTEKTKRGFWSKMSIAFLCLPVILCDDHMLSYHHTGLYYPEEGLYLFETVGYVDDQEIDMYSSESCMNIPKSVWMEKHEDNDYWEKQTSMRRGWEKVFRDNLMILASRFNYTRSSHTLQLSYGCALHDNNFTGYYRYGFDGKDFLIFNQDTLLWTPGMQKAEISAQRWNSDSDIGKGVKSYLTEHCKSALKKYIGYGREELEKRVVPEVFVKGQRINGNLSLQCLVYGFYPRPVDVKWVRNGEDDVPSDEMTPILPHPDGTYQIRVSVEVPTKEGDTYSCHVDHSSLENVITKKWEPDHANILHIKIILCALALLLAVSVLAFVLKHLGKWKKEPETTGCLLRTQNPHHSDNL